MRNLRIDPERVKRIGSFKNITGIFIRAQDENNKWDAVDIYYLDLPSLDIFLKSKGGNNEWAENTVKIILDHDIGGENA